MKVKILPYLALTLLAMGCNNPKKPAEKQEVKTFSGEFLYLADAAVLNTGTDVYGVNINAEMHQLQDMVLPLKKDEFDMIPVYIKGFLTDNTAPEGWPQILTIVAIDSVSSIRKEDNNRIQLSIEN